MRKIAYSDFSRTFLAVVSLMISVVASSANACSFMETKTVVAEDGVEEAAHTDRDYVIWGKVRGSRAVGKSHLVKSAPENKKRIVKIDDSVEDVAVTAIEIEVVNSDTPKAKSGDIVYFYLFNVVDMTCKTKAYAFDMLQYPIGSVIRVVNHGHGIPQWEVQKRFRIVKQLKKKSPTH